MQYGLHPETCRELGLHFNLEQSIWKANFLSSEFPFRNATKTVELRMKYINRKLVIVRVTLYILKFDVIVVNMSIYDVEMLYFDRNCHRQNIVDTGMYNWCTK